MGTDKEQERPAGYKWHELPEMGTKILMPDYWFTRRVTTNMPGHLVTINIARENMFKRNFKTGVAISATDRSIDPDSVSLEKAHEIAKVPDGFLLNTDIISTTEDQDFAGIEYTGTRNVDFQMPGNVQRVFAGLVAKPEPNFRHYKVAISKKTGIVFMANFECPSDRIEQDYPKGQKMLQSLAFNPLVPGRVT